MLLCNELMRSSSLHVGLRGAVEPELVMEVELSSWSWYPRRLRMEPCRGREDLLSGLRDPPSCGQTPRDETGEFLDLSSSSVRGEIVSSAHYDKMKERFEKIIIMVWFRAPELHLHCCSTKHLPWLGISVRLGSREALLRKGEVYLMRQSLWIWRWGSLLVANAGNGTEMVQWWLPGG